MSGGPRGGGGPRSRWVAVFRVVLRLYPESFRSRWGDEMRRTFEHRLAASGRTSDVVRDLGGIARAGLAARFGGGVVAEPFAGRSRSGAIEATLQDLHYAARGVARNPGFSLVVVLVLALGIGANTAIFSAVNSVLLKPLPVASPDRLVQVWEENPEKDWYQQVAAPANFLNWRSQVEGFRDAAGHTGSGNLTLTGTGTPELVMTGFVTGNFFDVMGVRPVHGRGFRWEETWSDAPRVVVLSDGFWNRRFARDPSIVGRTLTLDDLPFEVVGVMPPGFTFPGDALDLWMPVRWDPAARDEVWFRRAHFLDVIARLADGVSLEQAEAQLDAVALRLQRDHPETNRLMGAGITPLHEFLVGETRAPLLILLGATGLLLVLACANVANLMLVRGAGRQRELALRAALGAGRGRVVRQLLAESLTLAALGGLAGAALAAAALRVLGALQPPGSLRFDDASLDARVLLFALAAALASGVLFGVAPALRAAGGDAAAALKEGLRTTSTRAMRRASGALVVAEVTLAVLLVIGAGLLLRSFTELRRVDPGVEIEDRIGVALSLPGSRYQSGDAVLAFIDALVPRLERLPGVRAVTYTSKLPLTGFAWTGDFVVAGRAPGEYGTEIAHRPVAASYFDVMRVPVLRGRGLTEADRAGSEPVVVINDALRRAFFASEDPIGRRIAFNRVPSDTSVWHRIIGVVGDERQVGLHQPPRIEVFEPFRLQFSNTFWVVLETAREPAALAESIRAELATLDPLLPIQAVRPLEEVYAKSLGRDRFLLTLIGAFAALALLLAAVGVYGVTAQAARRRTREIGIRVALGARSAGVARMILAQGLGLTVAGIVLGLAGAFAGGRVLASVLYGVSTRDALTFAVVPFVLAMASAIACALPAWRAARVDPVIALRDE